VILESSVVTKCDQLRQDLAETLDRVLPVTAHGRLRWRVLLLWYLLTNAPHLGLLNSIFWDDWPWITGGEGFGSACAVDNCKIPFTSIYMTPMLELGVWSLHLLTFLVFGVIGWLFSRLLKSSLVLSEWQQAVATSLFFLVPINGARVALVVLPYLLMLLLFFAGAALLTRETALATCSGLLLVGLSMFMPSIQVFGLSLLVLLGARDLKRADCVSRKTWIITGVVLLLAFASRYWVPEFLVSRGVFSEAIGYNSIKKVFLLRAIIACGLLAAPFLVQILWHFVRNNRLRGFSPSLGSVGLLLLALGTFPYMSVGHFPNISDWLEVFLPDNSDWSSRHQVLQGAGYSLLLTAGLKFVVSDRRKFAVMTAFCVCAILSFSTFANYYVDSLKQRDVINQIRQARDELHGVHLMRFDDLALDLNARGRGIRDYEWRGMVKEALGADIEVYEESSPAGPCFAKSIGRVVEVRKTGGRLRALVTRSQVAQITITDLIACSMDE